MTFNNKRFLELIKESIILHQEGKFLRDLDKAKYEELREYLILLQNNIIWKSRHQYLQILVLFICNDITVGNFISRYNQLLKSNFEAFEKFKKDLEDKLSQSSELELQINPQSSEFAKIIFSIQNEIELFDPNVTLEMNFKKPELLLYGMSEEFWKSHLIGTVLPKIQKYCKTFKVSYNISICLRTKIILFFLLIKTYNSYHH